MPALANERREQFAQLVAKGMSGQSAALKAGYRPIMAKNAHRIKRASEVSRRISEIVNQSIAAQDRAALKYDVTAERVIGELARIGFANLQDYVDFNDDGSITYRLDRITRDQAAALAEITVDEFVEGKGKLARPVKRTRVKFHDKRQALVDLGKHLGLFVDPSVINMNVANFFSEAPPTMDEWKREIGEQMTIEGKTVDKRATRRRSGTLD